MLKQIQVVLIWSAGAVGLVSAQAQDTIRNPGSDRPFALENEYVKAAVLPPVSPTSRRSINLCFNLEDFPFVRLYLPTPKADTPDPNDGHGVFTGYFGRMEPFGCSAQIDGTTVYVYLKTAPPKSTFIDDAVKSDADHDELLFENDRVRIVRVHLRPGESGPMVDKRPRVIAAVTDSHATVEFPDGHSEPREVKSGTVSFGTAGRQATKNTGTTPLENIVVELKSKEPEKK